MELTQGLLSAYKGIIIPPIFTNRGWGMMGAAEKQVKEEMTGSQRMLKALDGMIATSQRLSKLCDDFIAGQPERERVYLDFIDSVSPEPERFALRPEDKEALYDTLNNKLREIRREPS